MFYLFALKGELVLHQRRKGHQMLHRNVFGGLGVQVPRMGEFARTHAERILREIHPDLRFCDCKIQKAGAGRNNVQRVWINGRVGIPDETWIFDTLSGFNFEISLQRLPKQAQGEPVPYRFQSALLNCGIDWYDLAEGHQFLRQAIEEWQNSNQTQGA